SLAPSASGAAADASLRSDGHDDTSVTASRPIGQRRPRLVAGVARPADRRLPVRSCPSPARPAVHGNREEKEKKIRFGFRFAQVPGRRFSETVFQGGGTSDSSRTSNGRTEEPPTPPTPSATGRDRRYDDERDDERQDGEG